MLKQEGYDLIGVTFEVCNVEGPRFLEDAAQLRNYINATKRKVGYLINFGNSTELEWKRIIS